MSTDKVYDALTGTWLTTPYFADPLPIANGGTGQITAQLAINALSAVSAATNEYVLTKDTGTGNALWKVVTAGNMNYSDARFKVISTTRVLNAGSGAVAYTGIGFTPKGILVFAEYDANCMSFGSTAGGTSANTGAYKASLQATWFGTQLIGFLNAAGSGITDGVLTSFDADGCTITYTEYVATAATAHLQMIYLR